MHGRERHVTAKWCLPENNDYRQVIKKKGFVVLVGEPYYEMKFLQKLAHNMHTFTSSFTAFDEMVESSIYKCIGYLVGWDNWIN